MKTAKLAPNQPIGFQPGAQLFELSTDIDYKSQTAKISPKGKLEHEILKTKFIVFSPGKNGIPKLFAADKKGYCVSWFHIQEFKAALEPAAAFKKIGYELIG